jgi:hypothetical protein
VDLSVRIGRGRAVLPPCALGRYRDNGHAPLSADARNKLNSSDWDDERDGAGRAARNH